MAELEDRLNSVLSDPEQMERIAQMASKLMGSIAPESGTQPSSGGNDALMGLVGQVMGSMQGDGKRTQLLQGLSPYLTKARQKRLARALRIASAAKLAGTAMNTLGGDGYDAL